MEKSVIIHLGGPKTGSSALQAFLAKNRPSLLAHGIDYPALEDLALAELGEVSSGNGVGVALHFLEPGRHEAKQAYLRFQETLNSQSAPIILLSSEHFAYMRGDDFAKCREQARKAGRKLRLMMYIRPQIEALISTYAQRIKRHCEISSVEEFWNRHLKTFDYLPSLRGFEAAVGRENLTVRLYLRERFVGGDVINDFGSILGVDFSRDDFTRFQHEINPTPNPHELALLRFLNRFKRVEYESGISDSLLNVIKDERTPSKDKCRPWLSDELSAKIVRHYLYANAEVSARYLGGLPFSADTGRPPQTIDIDGLPEPDPMVKGMAKLYLSMFRAFHRQQHSINLLLRDREPR